MATENRQQQPRALTSEQALVPTYRAGMYAELQKFGSSDRDLQLSLWEQEPEEDASSVTVTTSGLDLSVTEDKALSALQILLDETGYQGNRPPQEAESSRYRWRGKLPRLEISFSEYFEAYGLTPAGDGYYHGRQVDEALQALRNLATEPRAIYYERTRHKDGRKRADIVRIKAPIIHLTELTAWQELDEEEAERVRAGEDILDKQRATGLLVEVAPLLVDQIEDFYLLKPVALYKEIQDHLGPRKVAHSTFLFADWLQTLDLPTIKIRKKLLAERLRLQKILEHRRWKRLDQRLEEAIEVASELGFLLDAREEPPGLYTFWLNPARCSRVKSKLDQEEEEET
jgi:hypothetical protein